MATEQTVPYSDEGEWIGTWFAPQIHSRYQIPINSLNHKSEAGRTGTCIARRFNGFGMSWALLEFDDDDDPEKENIKWIRTPFLIETE